MREFESQAPWEHGSDFHWPAAEAGAMGPPSFQSLYRCGRHALRAAVAELGARRVFLPDYYCDEVQDDLESHGVAVQLYRAPPGEEVEFPTLGEGELGVALNLFGWGLRLPSAAQAGAWLQDHSHDPLAPAAWKVDAGRCFASIRKAWPLPDGGALWGFTTPPEEAELGDPRPVLAKFEGMLLKRAYLEGREEDKTRFRRRLALGEETLAQGPISGLSGASRGLLKELNFEARRSARAMSWASLGQALRAGPAGSLVFEPEGRDLEGVPFAQILRVGEARDELRRALIEARIYSAVLWPLDERPGRSAESLSFSRESLALHCDPRWDEQDLLRVAGAVHKAWEAIS